MGSAAQLTRHKAEAGLTKPAFCVGRGPVARPVFAKAFAPQTGVQITFNPLEEQRNWKTCEGFDRI